MKANLNENKRRILATKKPAQAAEKREPLHFVRLSKEDIAVLRNPASKYLIK